MCPHSALTACSTPAALAENYMIGTIQEQSPQQRCLYLCGWQRNFQKVSAGALESTAILVGFPCAHPSGRVRAVPLTLAWPFISTTLEMAQAGGAPPGCPSWALLSDRVALQGPCSGGTGRQEMETLGRPLGYLPKGEKLPQSLSSGLR